MTPELPRVLRRALGLMRFAREAVEASAASIFLVDDDDRLHGLVSDWDWTRTSFSSQLADWPSVRESLARGEPRRISARDAQGAERGWFEARGIASTLCIPLRDRERALGILFFDFAHDLPLGRAADALLADVGRRCARALSRAPLALPPSDPRWIH